MEEMEKEGWADGRKGGQGGRANRRPFPWLLQNIKFSRSRKREMGGQKEVRTTKEVYRGGEEGHLEVRVEIERDRKW